MAFSETAFKLYALRVPGNVRTWAFGGGNGNTTGVFLTLPTNIEIEVFGVFDSGTVTVQFAADNSTFAVLTTATITFTTAGVKLISKNDCQTGFFRLALAGTAGATSDLIANLIALGSTDVT